MRTADLEEALIGIGNSGSRSSVVKGWRLNDIAVLNKSSQSYKASLATLVVGYKLQSYNYIPRSYGLSISRQSPIQVVTSNRAWCRASSLIETKVLTTTPPPPRGCRQLLSSPAISARNYALALSITRSIQRFNDWILYRWIHWQRLTS